MSDNVENLSSEMQEALRALLSLAGMPTGKLSISSEDVLTAVNQVRRMLLEARMGQAEDAENKAGTAQAEKTVLIAGELGIIIHQLKQSLVRLGAEVTTTNDLFEAVNIHNQQPFRVVILDANMTGHERSLSDIVKKAHQRALKTEIIVLIQPSKDNHFLQRCKDIGATVVIPKDEGWQSFIFEYLKAIGF